MCDIKLVISVLLLVLFKVLVIHGFDDFDYVDYNKYCALDCVSQYGAAKHTICKRQKMNCGPSHRCTNYENVPLVGELRQQILDLHNSLRNNVAMGNETRGMYNEPQPKAANMNTLTWNDELAVIAQCWANACDFSHDSCRRTETLLVGQNLAWRGQSWREGLTDFEIFKILIDSWYDEVADFNIVDVGHFQGSSPGTGHYSEMIWGELEYIGCAAVTYDENSWYKLFLVCNYGGKNTPGNYYGKEIYKVGSPCTSCTHSQGCNRKFRALCDTDDSTHRSYYKPSTHTPNNEYNRNEHEMTYFDSQADDLQQKNNAYVIMVSMFWLSFYKLILE